MAENPKWDPKHWPSVKRHRFTTDVWFHAELALSSSLGRKEAARILETLQKQLAKARAA